MVIRARELRTAGWSYVRIAELLTHEFRPDQPVHRSTVYRWTGGARCRSPGAGAGT